MSLDFDYSGENYQGIPLRDVMFDEGGVMKDKSHSIIWAHLATHVELEDPQDAREFYARYEMMQRVMGFTPFFTFEDVAQHIGLKTNVTPMTREEWLKYLAPIVGSRVQSLFVYTLDRAEKVYDATDRLRKGE